MRLVSRLLKSAPALKLLVTSRERLRLEEEWLLPLHGLGLTSEAAAYFSQAAKRLQPGFRLEGNLTEVNQICELVGGSPLAIEMAAAWTPLLSLARAGCQDSRESGFLIQPQAGCAGQAAQYQGNF